MIQSSQSETMSIDAGIFLATEASRNKLLDKALESGDPNSVAAALRAISESRELADRMKHAIVSRD